MEVKGYIKSYEKLGFGMFIHFGLYSIVGNGEWVNSGETVISRDDYRSLINSFRVKEGFIKELVSVAVNAGCKYAILTTRHHDGFSLYDTRGLSDFDVIHSPTGRDLVREFVDECRANGLSPFLYHTGIDWNRSEYSSDYEAYRRYLYESVELLSKNYGKIGGFWFDGFWDDRDWHLDELFGMIRKNQPEAMIVFNRGLINNDPGSKEIDCLTFERNKPRVEMQSGKYRAREMCQVLNDHWGYAENDINYKSVREILEDLILCRRYRSNFVLNVGPSMNGISALEKGIFGAIGKWMSVFGKVITEGEPLDAEADNPNDFIVEMNGKYYLVVYGLRSCGDINVVMGCGGGKSVTVKNFNKTVKSVKWYDSGRDIEYEQNGSEIAFKFAPFDYSYNMIVRIAEIEVYNNGR